MPPTTILPQKGTLFHCNKFATVIFRLRSLYTGCQTIHRLASVIRPPKPGRQPHVLSLLIRAASFLRLPVVFKTFQMQLQLLQCCPNRESPGEFTTKNSPAKIFLELSFFLEPMYHLIRLGIAIMFTRSDKYLGMLFWVSLFT